MKTIWKFLLTPGSRCCVEMPLDAEILCADEQNESIYIWALVDPDMRKVNRLFQVIGTGWQMEEEIGKYISTVQLANGNLIFHVFEL